ncbi:response regulator transcription factor [Conexibacter sp. JD483]|uniref:response regulator transcription factor n=1 Tax=unclassified Conexibacter TaxID=2627773 RepID=UPI002723FB28|nr:MULTISPECIES: response regulator transcription factor [unclassified Conexibacter]MDO8184753.1 response regulator transcription factor [Conexibacter sp. CPCC 205706]MDO8196528.1 response regulator transcription factor [Conexibacter sp. CPCC 205762]MDR9369014.1 response regulator transcription factor [Conexibacter sp. JD483]
MRVVIGEDQVLMREGLRLVLEGAGFTIEALAEDARDLVRRALGLRPDLVIADIRMPPDLTDDGLRAVLQLRAERPEQPVMVLSQHVHRRYAVELLRGGDRGVGYLLKERIADLESFIADLHRVLDGGTVLDPVVVAAMIDRPRPGDPLADLTRRQREVLALMAEGRSNAAIAGRLHITEKSVVGHISLVYDALGIDQSSDDHRRVLAVVRYLSS